MLLFILSIGKSVPGHKVSTPEHKDSCTMCGKMCSIRNMNKILEGKDINLLRED